MVPFLEVSPGPARPRRLLLWVLGGYAASVVLEEAVLRPPGGQWPTFEFVTNPFFAVALVGSYLLLLLGERDRREALVGAALAVPLAAFFYASARRLELEAFTTPFAVAWGLGVGALAVLAVASARSSGAERRRALDALSTAALVPAYLLLSLFFLRLTIYLHPTTLDRVVYRAGAALGEEPSFTVGRLFARAPWFADVTSAVYLGLPAALALVYARRSRSPRLATSDLLTAFVLTGVAGGVLYHAFPVVGPVYMFPGYPFDARPSAEFGAGAAVEPVMRNCMPSLHTAWALLLYWYARPLGRWIRGGALTWLVLTLLATLGLGYHYVIDLVVAFPFALTMRAWCVSPLESLRRPRLRAGLFGGLLVGGWFAVLLTTRGDLGGPAVALLAMVGTAASSWELERRLSQREATAVDLPLAQPAPNAPAGGNGVIVATFFLSGFAGLVYEVVFGKSLALTFGSTAIASTTVLAVYMGGIALGSYLGGVLAERSRRPLRSYAYAELGVAVSCALTPWSFGAIRAIYARVAAGTTPGSSGQITLQFALGAGVLLVPTLLMGVTLPLLVRHLRDRGRVMGHAVAELYGANTLGAALGALAAGYVILPLFGVAGTTWLAVATNLVAALSGFRLVARDGPDGPPRSADVTGDEGATSTLPPAAAWVGLVVLGVGGFVTLALETTSVHVLSIVAGNSTYAFSLMLFSFLLGLAGGSAVGRRLLRSPLPVPALLVAVEAALCASVLIGVFAWQAIPDYFASYAGFPIAPHFAGREFIRFVVCFLTMAPPALCIGAAYPLAMHCATESAGGRQLLALGRAAALNTAGNIAGALVAAFVLLPRFGSLGTAYGLAGLCFLVALVPFAAIATSRTRVGAALALGSVLALLPWMPRELDYSRLATGANVYFFAQRYGTVIDHAEAMDGGLTTVAESRDPKRGARVLTLLTNGKFEGDDGESREMQAECGFALYPLLHTATRGRALLIGLGTGITARVLHDAGFEHLDVAELSADVVRLASQYFRKVNHGVLSRAGVRTVVTDGRNLLLVQPDKYDLVSVEISSIWFAGGASLYNREFYELVKARLSPHGVVQQWLQLHRLAPADLVSILATMRSEFRYVSLYFSGTQGVLVACNDDCKPGPETLARLDDNPDLKDVLRLLGGHAAVLLDRRLLAPDSTDRLLEESRRQGLDADAIVSTDDNLLLEYETPKANVRDYDTSLAQNLAFLSRFTPRSSLDGTALAVTRRPESPPGVERP